MIKCGVGLLKKNSQTKTDMLSSQKYKFDVEQNVQLLSNSNNTDYQDSF